MAQSYRPEPGIASNDELKTAEEQLQAALDNRLYHRVYAKRWGKRGSSDETIVVRLSEDRMATKETVLNQALRSDAPVKLRDLHGDNPHKLTFYPTNQGEGQ